MGRLGRGRGRLRWYQPLAIRLDHHYRKRIAPTRDHFGTRSRLPQKRPSLLWSVRTPLDIAHNGEVGGEACTAWQSRNSKSRKRSRALLNSTGPVIP